MNKVFGTLWLAFICLSSHASTSTFPFEKSSCFSGIFKDEETYLGNTLKRIKKHPTETIKKNIRKKYQSWQNIDRNEVICRTFIYVVDDIPVLGFYLKPIQKPDQDLKPIIFNRGGNASRTFSTPYFFDKLAPLARKGYLIVGSMYRGAKFNNQPNPHFLKDEFGGKDVNDVLALLPIIDSFDGMNSKKVAIWGVSRGGMMAFLAAKKSDRFSAIIAESSPFDLIMSYELSGGRMDKVYKKWIPSYPANREQSLIDRSVAYWFKELNDLPILILHGSKDKRTLPQVTLSFAAKLQKANYPYELVMYRDARHGLRGLEQENTDRISRWVDSNFRPYTQKALQASTNQ